MSDQTHARTDHDLAPGEEALDIVTVFERGRQPVHPAGTTTTPR